MTAQGSAHSRLRRALDHGASALVVRALALEAGRLELHDALAVCLVVLEGEPERYGAWAARWASRFVHEDLVRGCAQLRDRQTPRAGTSHDRKRMRQNWS